MSRSFLRATVFALCLALVGCAKHHSSSPYASPYSAISGSNSVALSVAADNRLMTSVEVCVPGTTSCQTISNIVVDTGSSGLRLFASQLTLTLPKETLNSGDDLGECAAFLTAYDWGWVGTADIKIADETASAAPVQVVADANFPGAPLACTGSGLPANTSAATFGANGVLGVGVLPQDCGADCASDTGSTLNYFDCTSAGTCSAAAAPLSLQVQNPVALFAKDNNGVIVSLPAADSNGSSDISGSLTFGIGTESNNAIASTVPIYDTSSTGLLTATYNGAAYTTSYLASGLAYTGILDSSSISGVSDCAFGGSEQGYYCPSNTVDATVTLTGTNAPASTSSNSSTTSTSTIGTATVTIGIANAATLFSNTTDTAFNDLAGPAEKAVILGLPFFFGRNVYVALSSATTSAGNGPFYGF